MDQINPECHNMKQLLDQKDREIEKLKLQILALTELLHKYNQKEKRYQFTSVTENVENREVASCESQISGTQNIEINSVCSEHRTVETQTSDWGDFHRGNLKIDITVDTSHFREPSNSVSIQDYIYDEVHKMYYSPSTGYYYDENRGLLYEPKTGAYYKYDYSKNAYELFTEDSHNDSEKLADSVVDKVNNLHLDDVDDNIPNVKTEAHTSESADSDGNIIAADENCNTTDENCYAADENCSAADENCNAEVTNDLTENKVDEQNTTSDWKPPEGTSTTVADMVKEVVEEHSGMSDYTYDEKSKMYYCSSNGCFYDPIRMLLYDPSSGIYYLYDIDKKSYSFYCKVDPNPNTEETKNMSEENKSLQRKKEKLKARKAFWKKKNSQISEKSCKSETDTEPYLSPEHSEDICEENYSSLEEGEIFSSDSENEISEARDDVKVLSSENSSDTWPPCIRAIVESSEKLKIGSLLLITYTGGIVGRDKNNAMYIPDMSVSKAHAEIKYNNELCKYNIEDLGSQNGTFINDIRLSKSKEKSEPHTLSHGDILALGSCRFLLHIHPGFETCNECEPGQVLAEISAQERPEIVYKTKKEKEKERRHELRNLKKKYGLQGMAFENVKFPNKDAGYEDKAEIRRQTVGSENPYEKTEEASVDQMMSESNKGYQMLKKMGWKEGESLGIKESGIVEPIAFRYWTSKAGLGSHNSMSSGKSHRDEKRKRKWVAAQERYFQLK